MSGDHGGVFHTQRIFATDWAQMNTDEIPSHLCVCMIAPQKTKRSPKYFSATVGSTLIGHRYPRQTR